MADAEKHQDNKKDRTLNKSGVHFNGVFGHAFLIDLSKHMM